MTAAEAAHAHFSHRLQVETDADDVATAIREDAVDFVLIDARSPAAFASAHLPGAINVPHRTITAEVAAALPAGPIVAYCWGPGCNAAIKAGARLSEHGREVREMLGGFEYFVREGHPVEGRNASFYTGDDSGLVAVPRTAAT